jgi:hypothetical protein
VTVTDEVPEEVVAAAVKVVVCEAPGPRERVDGLAVTPVGRADRETATVPAKEFRGLVVMVI